MGERGPAPKPQDQRARNEAKSRKESTTTVELPMTDQPAPRHNWRPEVVDFYLALGHVKRDPAEWQYALLCGDALEDCYAEGMPAAKLANVLKMQVALGMTAADRRRNGVETKPAKDDAPSAAVSKLHALKGGAAG